MKLNRRKFIDTSLKFGLVPIFLPSAISMKQTVGIQFDPWLEVSSEAIESNVKRISSLAGGRGIMAVVKNNGYGLGGSIVAKILEPLPEIIGFAAVKTQACIQLRETGISKPILHMGYASESDSDELVAKNIQLSIYTKDAGSRISKLSERFQKKIPAHIYMDTGMSRMGISYRKVPAWLDSLPKQQLAIEGTYMAFAESVDFDPVQLSRFKSVVEGATKQNIAMGKLHAASSNGVYHLPKAHLDFVRPGIALYGAYPSYPDKEKAIQPLTCAFSLKARIVRMDQLQKGDGVSYGRNYVAKEPVWVATIPVGHADGFTRKAVDGAKVLVGDHLYPVIGAVSASHTIIEVGHEKAIDVGDVVTLLGPDLPEIQPNAVARTTGTSVYDVLMHLNPNLPKKVL